MTTAPARLEAIEWNLEIIAERDGDLTPVSLVAGSHSENLISTIHGKIESPHSLGRWQTSATECPLSTHGGPSCLSVASASSNGCFRPKAELRRTPNDKRDFLVTSLFDY
jgi:hypothetical protein